ncbi:hypothetical protein [Qipengyuania gaetbuli]|nr:hypothetical protein [Qipengyuania gaetbuli]
MLQGALLIASLALLGGGAIAAKSAIDIQDSCYEAPSGWPR